MSTSHHQIIIKIVMNDIVDPPLKQSWSHDRSGTQIVMINIVWCIATNKSNASTNTSNALTNTPNALRLTRPLDYNPHALCWQQTWSTCHNNHLKWSKKLLHDLFTLGTRNRNCCSLPPLIMRVDTTINGCNSHSLDEVIISPLSHQGGKVNMFM